MELTQDHVALARALASVFHAGQVDKQDRPYIDHLAYVASALDGMPVVPFREQILGWLHDIVEDTPITLQIIEALFGRPTRVDVDVLTHWRGDPYVGVYIARICRAGSLAALRTKDRDLTHHLLDIDLAPSLAARRGEYDESRRLVRAAIADRFPYPPTARSAFDAHESLRP